MWSTVMVLSGCGRCAVRYLARVVAEDEELAHAFGFDGLARAFECV